MTSREISAFEARYNQALGLFSDRNESILRSFEEAVSSSRAVMNRTLASLSNWLNQGNAYFMTFHHQVEFLGREPSENDWDTQRATAEAAINPFSYKDINFAALTLDGAGMDYYGPYSVVLKDSLIEHRSSLLEENCFVFNRRHQIIAGSSPPPGYRSIWRDRGRLAVAKHCRELILAEATPDFASILISESRDSADCDFIEVHIYGPVHKFGIESISGPEPIKPADRALWKHVMRLARQIGIEVRQHR